MTDPDPAATPGPPQNVPPSRRRWLVRAAPAPAASTVVLLVGFVVLAVLVALGWSPLLGLDHVAVLAAHATVLAHPGLLSTARVVTDLGGPLAVDVVTAVVAVALLAGRRVRPALYLVVVRVLELGVETGTKHLLGRPRPNLPNPVDHASGFSFPSGHAAGSAAVYGALLVLVLVTTGRTTRPIAADSGSVAVQPVLRLRVVVVAGLVVAGLVVVVLVAAVAASRVLLGVHYPSDVTGGVLLGAACALAALPLHDARPGRRHRAASPPTTGNASSPTNGR